ncbi:hypothetical protein NMY22_g18821 [Coprinellus aureogranulatus]|nr:hypothetical protein NMY22_g18821 [Coprinellus aureogranulatus]
MWSSRRQPPLCDQATSEDPINDVSPHRRRLHFPHSQSASIASSFPASTHQRATILRRRHTDAGRSSPAKAA